MKKFRIFIISFLIILSLFNFKIIKIQGDSMYPILKDDSVAVVDRYLYKLFEIHKNDILLFEVDKKEVVKKIVGFPGEKVEIEGKRINLESNEIYVVGENLSESIDSREYGPIKTNQILGKVIIVF